MLSAGFINYSKIRDSLYIKLFLIFIAYSLLTEISAFIIGVLLRINTFPIYNTWNLMNHFFYLFFFLHLLQNSLKRKILKFIIGIYAVFTAVVISFYVDFLSKFLSINSVIGSILIVISIMIYFSELLQSDEILNLKKSIYFWISLGVLLFNIGFIPVYIIAEFIVFGGVFKIITFFLNLLMISCFVTGFIVSKKEYN
ncbi:hypothetical protein E2488_10325 [Gramella jeungdoensis]|uniref:Uncharacterized protein n=2 Tax=Flavobacteriaceae TaxID=49546 RepID=A0A4Y8ARP0_9FLAO|nr:hypothetical protein E2488_10325 [Gramella jeungdoensis]GGK38235.1 hypothetical protein GCM10007963_02960 [Lutibacter litoralis]